MAASVRIDSDAFGDLRFRRLGRLIGSDEYGALGRMAWLWRECTARQTHVLDEATVAEVVDPKHVVEAGLGEQVDGGIRIRGTNGRIEWLGKLRDARSAGGRARAANAARSGGQFASSPASSPAEHQLPAGTQLVESWQEPTSSTPGLASVPVTVTVPVPIPEKTGGVRGRARSQEPEPEPGPEPEPQPLPKPESESPLRGSSPPAFSSRSAERAGTKRAAKAVTEAERAEAERAIRFLNKRTGAAFRCEGYALELIAARMRDGATSDQLRIVIWDRCNEWLESERMRDCLRPKTLFRKSNFEEYLAIAEPRYLAGRSEPRAEEASRGAATPLLAMLRDAGGNSRG